MIRRVFVSLVATLGLLLVSGWGASAQTDLTLIRLSLGSNDPILDPALVGDVYSTFVVNQLFLGLVRDDDDTGEPLPQLASSWEVSPTADVYTFTLRSDVTWSDGSPVTAFDVRYSILRSLAPETENPAASNLYPIEYAQAYHNQELTLEEMEEIGGIRVLDTHRVRFNLNQPTAHFLSILSLPVARTVPQTAIAIHQNAWTEPDNIVTNGPYKLSVWIHGSSLILQKANNYFDAANVRIDSLLLTVKPESSAWQDFLAGALDSVIVPSNEWSTAQSNPMLRTQLHSTSGVCSTFFGFNTSKPPFDDIRIRKAFIAAFDRQNLIDTVLDYAELPALTVTPPGHVGHVDDPSENVGIPFNADQAQLLLAEAGYPAGEGLPSILLVYNQSALNQAIAEYAQQNWFDILGAPVALTAIDDDDIYSYINLLNSDPPQIWRLGLCSGYRDAYYHLMWFTGLLNGLFGAWDDAAYEAFLVQASRTADAEQRRLFYKFAEEILVEGEAVLLPLYYHAVGIATAPMLKRSYGGVGYSGYVADWRMDWQLFLPLVTSADE